MLIQCCLLVPCCSCSFASSTCERAMKGSCRQRLYGKQWGGWVEGLVSILLFFIDPQELQ